jgi:hypothetical protein
VRYVVKCFALLILQAFSPFSTQHRPPAHPVKTKIMADYNNSHLRCLAEALAALEVVCRHVKLRMTVVGPGASSLGSLASLLPTSASLSCNRRGQQSIPLSAARLGPFAITLHGSQGFRENKDTISNRGNYFSRDC